MSLMLAEHYDGRDPTGWWMSEKLDGVRAEWLPDKGQLLTRRGHRIIAPAWFAQHLPGVRLDMELFGGRRNFQWTQSVVRKLVPVDGEWRGIEACIIDLPDRTFTQFGWPNDLSLPGISWRIIDQTPCVNAQHLQSMFTYIIDNGGEGVMLRKPGSGYISGCRTTRLLKVKPEQHGVAVVTGHCAGKRRFTGMLGALSVTWLGHQFEIGTGFTDDERCNPPPIGSTIKFAYTCLTDDGVPRFARYERQ